MRRSRELQSERACEVMELERDRSATAADHPAAARGCREVSTTSSSTSTSEFHLRIAEGARLPILHAFLGQLRGFVRVATLGAMRPPLVLDEVVTEHERIVDAIEARDPPSCASGARGSPRAERLRTRRSAKRVLDDRRRALCPPRGERARRDRRASSGRSTSGSNTTASRRSARTCTRPTSNPSTSPDSG